MQLQEHQPVERRSLVLRDIDIPIPDDDQVLIRVSACGICHTDLHVIEGELPREKLPVVPGHQIVGVIEKKGRNVATFLVGERVGVAWLNWTDGTCEYCRRGKENLCENARFTGYHFDGGYAEYMVAHSSFLYRLPPTMPDFSAAPLLCAGIIGYRSLNLSAVQPGECLGVFGFGASAHIVLQLAKSRGCRVYIFSRDEQHRKLAETLGADWVGSADDNPPHLIDGAISFAPVGSLVPRALEKLKKGGILALAGIYMSPIPELDYGSLYHEKVIRSVANNTYRDGVDFLKEAEKISIKTEIEVYPLAEANEALQRLKSGKIQGAGVLAVN
jgi:propanol-preferring alcohol dehydrogenase